MSRISSGAILVLTLSRLSAPRHLSNTRTPSIPAIPHTPTLTDTTMSVTKQTIPYTTQRVILTSPKPLADVTNALHYELNAAKAGLLLMQTLANAKSRDDLEKGIAAITEGKRDFLYVLAKAPVSPSEALTYAH